MIVDPAVMVLALQVLLVIAGVTGLAIIAIKQGEELNDLRRQIRRVADAVRVNPDTGEFEPKERSGHDLVFLYRQLVLRKAVGAAQGGAGPRVEATMSKEEGSV